MLKAHQGASCTQHHFYSYQSSGTWTFYATDNAHYLISTQKAGQNSHLSRMVYNCVSTPGTWDTHTDRDERKGIHRYVNLLVYV